MSYSVCLESDLLALVEGFAESTNQTVDDCVNEAVLQWLCTTAAAVMEVRAERVVQKICA